MVMPAQERDMGSDAPTSLSNHFVLPSRNSKAIQISPPQGTNKPHKTPISKKSRSRSPQQPHQTPISHASALAAAQVSSSCITEKTSQNGEARHGAVSIAQSKQSNVPNGLNCPTSSSPSNKNVPETSKLDVYAPSYVPLWLKAVNESVAVPRFCSRLDAITYTDYISSFAGSKYLRPLAGVNLPVIQDVPVAHSFSVGSLTQESYGAYFWEALQNEVSAEAADLRYSNIFEAVMEPQDPLRHLFLVRVPGLRENSPRVELGDIVLVRPLFPRPDAPELTNAWYAPGGGRDRGLCAPAFSGLEFNAVVWGVARPKEEILLRFDGLSRLSCNIVFIVQEHRISPMARSITSTAESLLASHSAKATTDWLNRMLFPVPSDGVMQLMLPKGTFPNVKWFDSQLNYEQQKAVDAVADSNYGNVPYLVSGPPGTGKTKTIVEATLQLLQKAQHSAGGHSGTHPRPHILLCAPSDPAADTLASRLASHLTPAELFRLNGWSRSFSEVPGLLLPYSYVEKDLFSLPDFDTLMSFKVVVTTCRDADMLGQARVSNQALSHLTRSTLRAISPAADTVVPEPHLLHWTALLIDEAAQATEPEGLIPLTVVMPPPGLSSLPQFIMAGDEHQLGPRLSSKNPSALSTSLFTRLFSRACYAQHPLSRQKGSPRLTAAMLPMRRPAFTNLVRNYRSHPSILCIPSQLFYHDTLIPECTKLSAIVRSWSGWRPPHRWPVLFVQNTTSDAVESVLSGGGSGAGALFNHGEASNALQIAKTLLEHHVSTSEETEQIKQDEIAVMSPFKAQVHLLRKVFREHGLHDVNIGPLEAFQGLESRFVMLCTTRTRRGVQEKNAARFVREDQEKGLGVIGKPKRFNVAMTRAKEGLIVLGDPETLTVEGDVCWEAFMNFCARNGCVMFESKEMSSCLKFMEKFGKHSSFKEGRLERALVFAADARLREDARKERKGFGYPESPETRRQKKFSLKEQMLTNDEEMWKAGLQMAEEIDGFVTTEDGNADQRAEKENRDPDPWNSNHGPKTERQHLVVLETPTMSLVKPNATMPGEAALSGIEGRRVFSTASAKEFDRDPKAEFERTDCATQ